LLVIVVDVAGRGVNCVTLFWHPALMVLCLVSSMFSVLELAFPVGVGCLCGCCMVAGMDLGGLGSRNCGTAVGFCLFGLGLMLKSRCLILVRFAIYGVASCVSPLISYMFVG